MGRDSCYAADQRSNGPGAGLTQARGSQERAGTKTAVFLFHCPKTYPRLERWETAAHTTFDQWVGKLSRYLQSRRNPRDQKYMERLAAEIYAEFKPDQMRVVGADHRLPMLKWTRN